MPEIQLPPLFEKDLAQMRAGDVDGMLQNYHPDAQILRLPDVVATGAEEIRGFLVGYLSMKPKIVEVIAIEATEDTVVYHSTLDFSGTVRGIVGTWVLKDGLIWRQTAVIVPAAAAAG